MSQEQEAFRSAAMTLRAIFEELEDDGNYNDIKFERVVVPIDGKIVGCHRVEDLLACFDRAAAALATDPAPSIVPDDHTPLASRWTILKAISAEIENLPDGMLDMRDATASELFHLAALIIAEIEKRWRDGVTPAEATPASCPG